MHTMGLNRYSMYKEPFEEVAMNLKSIIENQKSQIEMITSKLVSDFLENNEDLDSVEVLGCIRGAIYLRDRLESVLDSELSRLIDPPEVAKGVVSRPKNRRTSKGNRKRLTHAEIDRMKELRRCGMSVNEIANQFDVTNFTVYKHTQGINIIDPNKPISIETIKWIKELDAEGISVEEIADTIEISQDAVRKYISGN